MQPKRRQKDRPRRSFFRPPPAAGAAGYFAPRRKLLLSAVTKVAKSTGRNCVSALPQRATVGCDFPHLLAGITFHHRCRSKGLRVRSPARRLTRPLASATAGVFRSCRRTPKPSPRVAHPLKPSPWGSAVLNDTPVACQIRGPTRRETGAPISRRRQPPPTHCGASRRNGRDLIIAKNDQRTSPYPRCCQRQRRKRYKRSPEPTMLPTALHARVHTAKSA